MKIKEKMEEKGHSAGWLAKKLNCDRSTIYKIYKKSNLDIDLLLRISRILHYDFFKDISVLSQDDDHP